MAPGDSFAVRASKNLVAGTVGGVGLCLVGHPFDTLKVLLQTQPIHQPIYSGLVDCFRKTIQSDGFGGLYKGIKSPLYGQMFFCAIKFLTYGNAVESLKQYGGTGKYFVAGGVTGIAVSFVETPVDLFKSQIQTQMMKLRQDPKAVPLYRGVGHCAKTILQTHGIRGAYQGLGATLIRNAPANALFFGGYESARHFFARGGSVYDLPPLLVLASGGIGGIMYWGITFPLDVVKSAMQCDSTVHSERRFRSWRDAVKQLYHEGGIRRFYGGLSPCLMRSIPANAILFFMVEKTKVLLDDWAISMPEM